MYKLNFLPIITILFCLVSCSNSDNNRTDTPVPDNNYTLVQSIDNIQELDNVAFTISGSNIIGISNTTWYINDIQINLSNYQFKNTAHSGVIFLKIKTNIIRDIFCRTH